MPTSLAEQRPPQTAEDMESEIPVGWRPSNAKPLPVVRCTFIKQDATRCKAWSLRGTTVCVAHGGRLPNVKKNAEARVEAARLRLIDNTDFAIDVLEQLMQPGSSEAIRLKASESVLDRAGIRGGFEVNVETEVTINPAETIMDRLAKLREGAEAVTEMRNKARHNPHPEIVDGEVVEDSDEQPTLF